jgi:hypothetical protein
VGDELADLAENEGAPREVMQALENMTSASSTARST